MTTTTTTDTTCRIYVASLSDYNAGTLHGEWIDLDADTTIDDVESAIAAMLAASPEARRSGLAAEEYAVHDHDNFGSYHVSEWPDLDELLAIVRGIDEHGDAFRAWLTIGDDPALFEDHYRGEWESREDYVAEYLEDCMGLDLSEFPYNYLDLGAIARDFELGGDVTFHEHGDRSVFVFEG